MALQFTLEIDEREMQRLILDEMVKMLEGVVSDMRPAIRNRVCQAIDILIRASSEYKSLTDPAGELRGQLGLIKGKSVDPEQFAGQLIQTICNNVQLDVERFVRRGDSVAGGLILRVLRADFADLLGLPGASYLSPENHHQIEWLRWLLVEGDRDLIRTHWYLRFPHKPGRAGLGIMIPSGATHHGWGVPKDFSGTAGDNWLTRAIAPLKDLVPRIFEEELSRRV